MIDLTPMLAGLAAPGLGVLKWIQARIMNAFGGRDPSCPACDGTTLELERGGDERKLQ